MMMPSKFPSVRCISEIISPSEFIPQAEKNGTIHKIGKFVIQNVCMFINDYYQLHGFYPKVLLVCYHYMILLDLIRFLRL